MDKVEAIEMMRAELIKMVNERCDALIQVIQKGECEKIPDLNVLEYGLAWSAPSILKGKKPLAVKFRDGDRIETNTWKKVAQTILEDCNSNQDMHERLMENGANEVMYKMADFLLKKMQENGLISEEEREKIAVLNIETFSPELAKVYL